MNSVQLSCAPTVVSNQLVDITLHSFFFFLNRFLVLGLTSYMFPQLLFSENLLNINICVSIKSKEDTMIKSCSSQIDGWSRHTVLYNLM